MIQPFSSRPSTEQTSRLTQDFSAPEISYRLHHDRERERERVSGHRRPSIPGKGFGAAVSSSPAPTMYSAGLEILGMILAVAGWLGVMVACGLPMWRVAAFIGQNIVISQVIWEGLWMNCSVQSTGQMHCRVHESMLGLPVDLQAARALVIVSMVLCIVGIGLSVAGAKCTNCSRDVSSKPRLVVAAGVTFAVAGLLLLVAVSWTAHAIVLGFYDPLLEETGKREFGNALYFGWAASCLLILGGALLCCSCPSKLAAPPNASGSAPSRVDYSAAKNISVRGYTRRDYV
uniref:Claudin-4-like n=1 Tax=Fundulus heteroclitus TaxID=8078 RepID=A0A3Q2PZ27_FUNHE